MLNQQPTLLSGRSCVGIATLLQRKLADIIIEVDRPVFTFTFTYKITDRSNGVLLTTGKITAFDGNAAAPLLTARIIEDIRKARGAVTK